MLTRLARPAIAASLAFACTPATTAAPPPRLEAGYLVVKPDVSVSRNAQPAIAKNVAVDEHSDVMAEILAIPPGR
ncbi:MAG: hypothetical protein EOO73_25435 [Myxococcales bacterium]|nr:MAG: hypothetical protein EOO73_25435 [Myxococcales bacterium]